MLNTPASAPASGSLCCRSAHLRPLPHPQAHPEQGGGRVRRQGGWPRRLGGGVRDGQACVWHTRALAEHWILSAQRAACCGDACLPSRAVTPCCTGRAQPISCPSLFYAQVGMVAPHLLRCLRGQAGRRLCCFAVQPPSLTCLFALVLHLSARVHLPLPPCRSTLWRLTLSRTRRSPRTRASTARPPCRRAPPPACAAACLPAGALAAVDTCPPSAASATHCPLALTLLKRPNPPSHPLQFFKDKALVKSMPGVKMKRDYRAIIDQHVPATANV